MEPTQEQAYRRRIAELEAEVLRLTEQLTVQAEQIRLLTERVAKLSKNSSNSSKPPSSDIVKPPKPANSRKKKRKIGGQPGHAKHERPPFSPDQIDGVRDYRLNGCPDCGGRVSARPKATRVVQQVEFIERPIEVVEHRAEGCWCRRCKKVVYAPLPATVQKGGLLGPELTALVGYLKGVCHASFSTIRKYFRDVLKIPISRGQLVKVIGKVSMAMGPAYEELRASLSSEPHLNVDETGHKNNGKPHWTWCFRAERYTLFKIAPTRGSVVLIDMLGKEFNGILGCDYFSAYRKYMREFGVELQFCLAHLIREVKFLIGLPHERTRVYGERLLDALRQMFRIIHRRETMTLKGFQRTLEKARTDVINAALWAPRCSPAKNLAKRFRLHGDAYFRFITTPGVEPTNNLAEQAIRFVVIDRRITQGTRSQRGQRWCERIWTAIATCTQQGRSVFEYLREAVSAHFNDQPIPSLIPAGP
ncbi:MAG: IS66 family transposase [Pirellulaceae bacterium]